MVLIAYIILNPGKIRVYIYAFKYKAYNYPSARL